MPQDNTNTTERAEWYVVHTYSGYENKVKDNILRRAESFDMKDLIFRVIVAEYEEPVKTNAQIVEEYINSLENQSTNDTTKSLTR